MSKTELKDEVSALAQSLGANLCGVADLGARKDFIAETYGEKWAAYPRAVSLAVFFPREVVLEQLDGPTRSYSYFYAAINRQLDTIGLAVSNLLQTKGCRAYPVPTSDYRLAGEAKGLHERLAAGESPEPFHTERVGMFSHRLAAVLAGLGWVGKNCSLITPQAGPRLRLTTVLTNAPLPPGKPIENRCGSCTRCRDICPPRALKGVAFREEDPVDVRLDRERCNAYLDRVASVFGRHTCARCLAVCPWGRK